MRFGVSIWLQIATLPLDSGHAHTLCGQLHMHIGVSPPGKGSRKTSTDQKHLFDNGGPIRFFFCCCCNTVSGNWDKLAPYPALLIHAVELHCGKRWHQILTRKKNAWILKKTTSLGFAALILSLFWKLPVMSPTMLQKCNTKSMESKMLFASHISMRIYAPIELFKRKAYQIT